MAPVVAGRSGGPLRLGTIGVYGFDEETFHRRLREFSTDLVVDVRRRRGVRGAGCAFANSLRLQHALATRGIAYAHVLALAPTPAMRELQARADAALGVSGRGRDHLDAAYSRAYRAALDDEAFECASSALGDAAAPVLLCVERDASACHRSLAAAWLADRLSPSGVTHLEP